MLRAHFTITASFLSLLLLLLLSSAATGDRHGRRLLHHPFSTPTSLPPSPSPRSPSHHNSTNTPKFPFSDSSSSPPPTDAAASTAADTTGGSPFFPTYPSQPPPPPPSTALATFPANISSLALPGSSAASHSHSPVSTKLVVVLGLLSFIAASLFVSLIVIIRRKSRREFRDPAENIGFYLSTDPTPDSRPPPKLPPNGVSNTSSEFLYLGTMANSCEFEPAIEGPSSVPEVYLKLCGDSPELKPLPPLPKQSFHGSFEANFDEEEFYSPKGYNSSSRRAFDSEESENFGMKSCISSYPDSNSPTLPENSTHHSPENAGSRSLASSPSRDSDVSVEIMELAHRTGHFPTQPQKPNPTAPPPPPPPAPAPATSWASWGSGSGGPPPLVPPSGPVVFRKSGPVGGRESIERTEEMLGKPKLKALHWDKVRASSDRVMVWDQLHPGSFQLNEEMIETLFKANGPHVGAKDGARRSIMPLLNEEMRVLDPKKSQNIAILLKALNVTEEEACEALLEGNADTLGTELLESLLKMAPTKEEERHLRDYKDESPLKLGPAEKFLKAVLDVPFAFKRVDAMLYMVTFDSEVEYLGRSFETLGGACQELRNSRMFLKLLEAVLKTGNRMNVGTNRGDAQAFKLDTLLKLVDIKGTDGKTTLLHFVVQEIINAEGSRLAYLTNDATSGKTHDPSPLLDGVELRKRGLEVVSGLGSELANVKKAATMDSEALSSDVAKLARGVIRVNEVLQLNKEAVMNDTNKRFSESMNAFLKKAEQEIVRIQSQESSAFSRVKEVTEYFHGNSAKEEAHPLRIFMVVRDFLGILDQVCKEVGRINERTIISSSRPSFVPVNQTMPPSFPELRGTMRESSSDDEGIDALT